TLTAKFATVAEAAAAVTARLDGLSFGSGMPERTTNIVCGVAVAWPVSAAGLTTTTVSVSGLPSGLSYAAKTGLVTGVPSVAQEKTVSIVAKTFAGTKVTYRLKIAVQALPVWASGTFNGGGDGGLLTLSIGSAGKMSGKYLVGGTNWTLSAKSYAAHDVRNDVFTANLLASYGKTVLTNRVTVTGDAEALLGQLSCARFTGWWNGWKTAACRDVAKAIDRATNLTYAVESPVPGTIRLSFGASGAVMAQGTFVVGENARTGRDITYSASCSTVLCRQDDSNILTVFVCFPPKKHVFDGYFACLELAFDGENVVF
ncbi:MAG: putative Ig domain-containing protein, partial [Kiritimatiellia bacterium]